MVGGDNCKSTNLNTVYVYNTRVRAWTLLGKRMLIAAYDIACSSAYFPDGKHVIVVAGGYTSGVGRRNTVQYLDLSNINGEWAAMPSLPITWAELPHLAYLGK